MRRIYRVMRIGGEVGGWRQREEAEGMRKYEGEPATLIIG
jgi:hypothetical protein